MTDNEQKQQLSIAYVHAIAASAGFACERPVVDDDSVDVMIAAQGKVHDTSVLRSPRIEVQLKATSQDVLAEEHLPYPLPIKNYNDLRNETAVPRLLVVLLLPPNPTEWLEQSEEQMISRRCAYYLSLLGQPDSSNTTTVTVRLPRTQCLTATNLREMMERVSRKEPL
jgi:hypothetical protein